MRVDSRRVSVDSRQVTCDRRCVTFDTIRFCSRYLWQVELRSKNLIHFTRQAVERLHPNHLEAVPHAVQIRDSSSNCRFAMNCEMVRSVCLYQSCTRFLRFQYASVASIYGLSSAAIASYSLLCSNCRLSVNSTTSPPRSTPASSTRAITNWLSLGR